MSKPLQPVTLNIHGKEYRIACAENERDTLLQTAQMLDQQMRKIHETGKVSGNDRIAVLAALNITHDLSQNTQSNQIIDFTERLLAMQHKIESVLEN